MKQESINVQVKKFWQSSNFWTYLVLLSGSLIVGFSEVETVATGMIGQIFALIAGGKVLHNFQKKGIGFDWSQIGSVNFWGYISMIATSITSAVIPDQLWTDFQLIAESLLLGNWTGAIGAVISAIAIIANLLKQKKNTEPDNLQTA